MSLTNPPPLVRVTFNGGPLDGKTKILTDAKGVKTSYAHPHGANMAAVYSVLGTEATFDNFVDSRTGEVVTL